jgi:hypothetical protein
MGVAFDRFTEALRASGYKVQAIGRDRARSGCPGHGGQDLNLAIAVGDQGVLLKCHSYDCPAADIANGVGLTMEDLFDADGQATYDYGNGHRVVRKRTREGKQIYQQHKPKVTALYRHPDSMPIEESDIVVLVEGEKCVDAALRLGERCVTTWPGGADNVGQVDLTPLSGKTVRIIADNDEAGRRAAARLVSRLEGLAEIESMWTGPREKQSVDDLWLDGGTLADLVPLLVDPEPIELPARSFVLTRLSDVRTRKPRFLWKDVLPFGCLTLMGGRGGVSKSSFMIYLAGLITNGQLQGELYGKPSPVLYVSHEDSLEEVVGNRCDANGVRRDLFFQLGIRSKEVDGVSVPRLPEDLGQIRAAIEQSGAKVIIVDPITSTMGGDNDKMADVRAVLDPLNQMGAELGVSILAIAHFRKGTGATSDLISGSHAYRDAARCVMLFAKDEDSGYTVATVEKSNYGVSGQSFEFETKIVQVMTDEGLHADTSQILWHGTSAKDVGDVISQETATGERQGMMADEILRFIESARGAVSTQQVVTEFKDSKATTIRSNLTRMSKRGVIESPAYGWWMMPTEQTPPPEDGSVAPVPAHAAGAAPATPGSGVALSREEKNPLSSGSVAGVAGAAAPTRAPARAEVCRSCGYPLHPSLIAAGENVHPGCD